METAEDDEEFCLSGGHSKRKPQEQTYAHDPSSKPPSTDIPRCFFLFYNASAHNSFSSRAALHRTQLDRLPQAPYSANLAICDFSDFGQLKTALVHSGIQATTLTILKTAVAQFDT